MAENYIDFKIKYKKYRIEISFLYSDAYEKTIYYIHRKIFTSETCFDKFGKMSYIEDVINNIFFESYCINIKMYENDKLIFSDFEEVSENKCLGYSPEYGYFTFQNLKKFNIITDLFEKYSNKIGMIEYKLPPCYTEEFKVLEEKYKETIKSQQTGFLSFFNKILIRMSFIPFDYNERDYVFNENFK